MLLFVVLVILLLSNVGYVDYVQQTGRTSIPPDSPERIMPFNNHRKGGSIAK